jgi:hypothetical protein
MDPDERAIGNRDTVKIAIVTVVSIVSGQPIPATPL